MAEPNNQSNELSLDQLDNVSAGFGGFIRAAKVAVLTKRALITHTITTGRAATKANKPAIKNLIREGDADMGFRGVNHSLNSVVPFGQVASYLAPKAVATGAAGGLIGMGVAGITRLFK